MNTTISAFAGAFLRRLLVMQTLALLVGVKISEVIHQGEKYLKPILFTLIGWFAAISLHETVQSLHYSKPGHLSLDAMPTIEFGAAGVIQCVVALTLQVIKVPSTAAWLIGEVVSDFILAKLQS
jgi:hypothetical protein